MYLARATSKRAVKLEEQVVVVFGVDDMDFGLSGSERLRRLTVDEGGKGERRTVFGVAPRCGPVYFWVGICHCHIHGERERERNGNGSVVT